MSQVEMVARTRVVVPGPPSEAFRLFTEGIGTWWKRGTQFWVDPERGRAMRFESRPGGRLIEVYDERNGEGLELGRITAWEPPHHLALTWRIPTWPDHEVSDIDVRFVVVEQGTEVTVLHDFTRAPSAPTRSRIYGDGWKVLLDLLAAHARA